MALVAAFAVIAMGADSCTGTDEPISTTAGGSSSSSDTEQSGTPEEVEEQARPKVADYGFYQGTGLSGYGVAVKNASQDADAIGVTVSVNALDARKRVVGSDSNDVSVIPAGETFNVGGDLDVGNAKIDDLEVTVDVRKSGPPELAVPSVSNVRVERDEFGFLTVRSQLTNDLPGTLSSLTDAFVVLKDSSGSIVGGGFTYPDNDLPKGRSTALSFNFFEEIPDASAAAVSVDNEGG